MVNITLIAIYPGKNCFHIPYQDRCGKAILGKMSSGPRLIEFLATLAVTTIVMAACAGCHFMAPTLTGSGDTPKLISPPVC